MSFMKNVWNKLSMFVRGVGEAYRSSPLGRLQNYAQSGGLLEDAAGKYLGTNLTGAEREANEFTRNERLEAQQWTAAREDTYYQRTMADMEKAGINPMMAASGGAGTSPSSGGQSVSPQGGSLSDLLQLALLPSQKKVMDAQAKNLNSQADNRDMLTPAQIEQIQQNIQESIAREHEAWKKAEELDYKIQLDISHMLLAEAQARLANVSADDLKALRESRIALNEARTAEAKAQATLAYWNAMYQKGLIDEGMCAKVAAKIAAETRLADKQGKLLDEQATRQAIENSVKSGHWSTEISQEGNAWDKVLMYLDRATSTLGNVLSLHN